MVQPITSDFILPFSQIGIQDLPRVGGKNASLGEMFSRLSLQGIPVPDGFAITADGYWEFLKYNQLETPLRALMQQLDMLEFSNLQAIGAQARAMLNKSELPKALEQDIRSGYLALQVRLGTTKSVAVRSSATAEDLPSASFAGQHETFLHVEGEEYLVKACIRCYASLFTDRAIKYRADHGFDQMKVALSIGVQAMIRADLAASGVMFTMDPDTGFENVVLIAGAWGLGENIVRGQVNTDEFLVFKPTLDTAKQPIIRHQLGSKLKTMVYSSKRSDEPLLPENAIVNIDTPEEKQNQFTLLDGEVIMLARWAVKIEQYYGRHMDIEWAKDGEDGGLYILQARPETVHSHRDLSIFKQYTLTEKGKVLTFGAGLGNRISSGKARILHSADEINKLNPGEILVTERTDPDWDPVMKKAAAIITDQGGRTSHAAIVAREVGAIAIVGTGNGTKRIRDGMEITVSTATGDTGYVYEGVLAWNEQTIDISSIGKPRTKVMFILAHPDEAFRYSFLPNDGVGLLRMEFIISNTITIHPMALKHPEKVTDTAILEKINAKTRGYTQKDDYFVDRLAVGTAMISAAFYPKPVIIRMSDFKSNEYANLIGGQFFEPKEENPMIGFRGASRYYHPLYREAFELECRAMKKVRETMGLTNVILMVPFCRTIEEARRTIEVMESCGLKRGEKGLELYVMIEIPSNALQAEEFAKYFDGFSIGSNDLTQLTLGADRDSALLSDVFSPFEPSVMQLIEMTLLKAKKTGTHTGLCGQAPSDYPEYAQFLVRNGIDSISFNPDALIKGIENICEAEGIAMEGGFGLGLRKGEKPTIY